jgi:outer membrane beta-barrel protein
MTSRALHLVGWLALLSSPAIAGDATTTPEPTLAAPVLSHAFTPDFGLALDDGLAQDEDEDESDDDEPTGGNRSSTGDDDDDDLGDILGTTEESVADERKAVEEGRIDGQAGVRGRDALDTPGEEDAKTRRTIKVIQRKNFLKIGRGELGGHIGFVTNDPFINRYLFGADFSYHVTEVFSLGIDGTFSPDFGQGDWKSITDQLVNNNKVSPDISKVIWNVNATTNFSPIYGKLAVVGGRIIVFDIYGIFGFGVVGTLDDEDAIQCNGPTDPCQTTLNQVHPTTTAGGGFRVAFSKKVAARIEGRTLSWVETLNGTSLEMKNYFILQAGGTYFFNLGGK